MIYIVTMNLTTGAPERPPGAAAASDAGEQVGRSILIDEIIAGTSVIAAHQRCAVARRLLRRGISMTHLQVLWILREHGDLSVSRLAELLGVAVPNATGLVDRMEQRGLVERDRDRADRRLVIVRPTSSGMATADEIDGWRSDLMAQVLARLDLEQLERIARGIRDIRAAFPAETSRPAGYPAGPAPHRAPAAAGQARPASHHAPAHPDSVSKAAPEVPTA